MIFRTQEYLLRECYFVINCHARLKISFDSYITSLIPAHICIFPRPHHKYLLTTFLSEDKINETNQTVECPFVSRLLEIWIFQKVIGPPKIRAIQNIDHAIDNKLTPLKEVTYTYIKYLHRADAQHGTY